MPFDSATSGNAQLLADLDLVAHRLRSPNGWCKGTHVNRTGNRVCLQGAVDVVEAIPRRKAVRWVLSRAALTRGYTSVIDLNDDRSVKHQDILALIEKAKAIVIQGSQHAL